MRRAATAQRRARMAARHWRLRLCECMYKGYVWYIFVTNGSINYYVHMLRTSPYTSHDLAMQPNRQHTAGTLSGSVTKHPKHGLEC